MRPIVAYGRETLSTIQGDEEKLLASKKKVSREIHKPIRNQNGQNERRKNVDPVRFYNKPSIKLFLKAKRWSRLVMFESLL